MEVQSVLHMTQGQGETSYALNSGYQKMVIVKAKPVVQEAITDLYCKTFQKSLRIADLGCSSGPNTLVVISEIIEAVCSVCQKLDHPSPEFQVFLNDLPGNDFNTIFKSISCFVEKHRTAGTGPCFIAGMPGSFYGRLFPVETLDFVHSSYSLHYLSQVPDGIENNKGNIHIAVTSPPSVPLAYLTQFQRDFTLFLSLRSEELVLEGRMVITILGRRSTDPYSTKEHFDPWEMLAQSLRDMVSQGLVEEAKLDSFNLPWYYPCVEEVKAVIQEQGSFHLNLLETFDVDEDKNDDYKIEDDDEYIKAVSRTIRAITESMLVSHFGEDIIDDLFDKFAEYVERKRLKYVNLIVSLTKKG